MLLPVPCTPAVWRLQILWIACSREDKREETTSTNSVDDSNDYQTDVKGEEEIRHIMDHLDHQDDLILQIVKRLEEQHMEMREQLARLDPTMAKQLGTDVITVSQELVDGSDDVAGNS